MEFSYMNILVPIILFGIIYFFMIRPMNKQAKEMRELQKNIQQGDVIMTNSGLKGTVVGFDNDFVELSVNQEDTRLMFNRGAIREKITN
ncbi:preprotein translocase subunit YajC [Abyssicoccus albus]|uniref:preprotein translocase subunit YajC n=1 Tax=Abyssicoccus albus TaxID=1817405 RepID=UPI0009F81EAB|nr:preprotein translocase subunit YajC [Abyssicoccus albus]